MPPISCGPAILQNDTEAASGSVGKGDVLTRTLTPVTQ